MVKIVKRDGRVEDFVKEKIAIKLELLLMSPEKSPMKSRRRFTKE